MVAFETAIQLQSQGIPVITAVVPNSPLAQKLQQRDLKTIALKPGHKYFSPAAIRQLRTTIQQERITTVLVQQLRDLWYVVPALVNHPTVRAIGMAHMWIDARKKGPIHRWLYGRLNRIVALTNSHKQNLRDHLPDGLPADTFAVLPNSVDLTRFYPGRRDPQVRHQLAPNVSDFLIGVVSRIDPKKGLLDVVAAAEKLKKANVKFRIVIVGSETRGEESFKAVLQAEIDRCHLQNEVVLTGHRADIEAVMASLDVLLMPSPAETFGRVLIEAMASQVAIVASRGGGVKDIIDDRRTGLAFDPGDTATMARALEELAQNPKLRAQLAANGLRQAQTTYDQKILNQQFLEMLI